MSTRRSFLASMFAAAAAPAIVKASSLMPVKALPHTAGTYLAMTIDHNGVLTVGNTHGRVVVVYDYASEPLAAQPMTWEPGDAEQALGRMKRPCLWVDGVRLQDGNRILRINSEQARDNGIYTVRVQ